MDYQRIYDQVVDQARQEERKKSKEIYYEKHHIIPKCLGGSNEEVNLVLLTGREHFLLHWMLVRIHPKNSKLAFAFWAMCNQKNKEQRKRCTPSSRAYQEGREVFMKLDKKATPSAFKLGELNINYWKGRVGPNLGLLGELNWNSKKVNQYTKQGTFVASYTSICEAERLTSVRNANIVQCCKGRLKTTGGFIWKYFEK